MIVSVVLKLDCLQKIYFFSKHVFHISLRSTIISDKISMILCSNIFNCLRWFPVRLKEYYKNIFALCWSHCYNLSMPLDAMSYVIQYKRVFSIFANYILFFCAFTQSVETSWHTINLFKSKNLQPTAYIIPEEKNISPTFMCRTECSQWSPWR